MFSEGEDTIDLQAEERSEDGEETEEVAEEDVEEEEGEVVPGEATEELLNDTAITRPRRTPKLPAYLKDYKLDR